MLEVGQFLDAAERVAQGGSALDPQVVSTLLSPAATERWPALRARAGGARADGGGAHERRHRHAAFLSERTVEAHVRNVLMKLDLPESEDGHCRVLAVLAHLSAAQAQG